MSEKTSGRIILSLIMILAFSTVVSCIHPALASDVEIHEESLFTSADPSDPVLPGASQPGSSPTGSSPSGSSLNGSSPDRYSLSGSSPDGSSLNGSSPDAINRSGNAVLERNILSGFPARQSTDKEAYNETLDTQSLYELLDTAEAVAGGQHDPYLSQYPDLSGGSGEFIMPEGADGTGVSEGAGGTTGTAASEESQEASAQPASGQTSEENPGKPADGNTIESPGQTAAQNAAGDGSNNQNGNGAEGGSVDGSGSVDDSDSTNVTGNTDGSSTNDNVNTDGNGNTNGSGSTDLYPDEYGKGPTDYPQEPSPEDYITPGAASFTVHKEADQESASPGDTVYYTITIRNTGAVILHSVLSTEKFQLTGIDARFLPQDGVRLNQNQTQALIEQIAPGESVSLRAAVVIPSGLKDQTLVNQVIVTTRETGTTEMTSNSSITVASGGQGGMGSGNSQSGTSGGNNTRTTGSQNGYTGGGNTAQTVPQTHSYSAADPVGLPPKTGDSSPLEILLCALAAAGSLILISLFLKFRRHNTHFHLGSGK